MKRRDGGRTLFVPGKFSGACSLSYDPSMTQDRGDVNPRYTYLQTQEGLQGIGCRLILFYVLLIDVDDIKVHLWPFI